VLGQQSGPEATATKGHLRRSEAARSWARSLLDSLEQFYENGSVPAIPDGERGRRAAAAAPREPREPREPRSAMGGRLAPTADRRWLMAGAAALIVILLAVVIWPVGALTGGDDNNSNASSGSGTQKTGGQSTTGQTGQAGQTSGAPAGIAIVVERNAKKQLLVQAARLTPSGQSEGYYVWLYNSPSDAKSLGGQVTDQNGNYQAIGPLPVDYKSFKYIDISRQQIASTADVKHSGNSVLRGKMPTLKKSTAQNGKTAAIGQTVLQPPA
jgi:hypothetical protein